ncbi:MAG: hypothetical protein WCE63_05150 [Acidobacteriaceae bacterium]
MAASLPVAKRTRILAPKGISFPRWELLPAYAARVGAAVFCADFLTMFLMNVARLKTTWLPVVFFGFFGIAAFFVFRSHLVPSIQPAYLSTAQRRRLTLLVLSIAVVLAAARLPYLLEGHLHHLVGPVVYDDSWHFQEINSLAHSAQYPARCSLIPTRYFSLYYAPWMMVVAIYLAIPLHGFTIKAAFAIGCAIYQFLLCMTLLYIGISRGHSRKQLYWAMYLIACWAGTESFFSAMYYLRRSPAWLLAADTPIHFPSLLTGILWAPHHATAAVALVLCWHIWDCAEGKSRPLFAVCCVLLAFAFYSSVFVFLGALPFVAYYFLRTARTNYKGLLVLTCVSSALVWPLLWLYLGKSQDVRFLFPFVKGVNDLFPYFAIGQFISVHPMLSSACAIGHGMIAGFLVFLLFIVSTFLLHAIALTFYGRRLGMDNVVLAAIAILFIVSTYFVGFPEGDNYASRGYVIPILVLGWICAEMLPEIRPRVWIVFGLLLGSFGLVHEGFSTFKHAIYIARMPLNPTYGTSIMAMNQDRHTCTISSSVFSKAFKDDPDLIYSVEKFVDGGKSHLVVADRQLECLGPRGPWRWQRLQSELRK